MEKPYCVHRWMIIEDYWNMGVHIVKYKCINCPQDYTQEFKDGMFDHER